MTSITESVDLANLSDRDLGKLLEQLEREESDVSRRRGRLHDRIDFVQAAAAADPNAADQLAGLRAQEREASARRHELHQQIDEVRAERTKRTGSKARGRVPDGK